MAAPVYRKARSNSQGHSGGQWYTGKSGTWTNKNGQCMVNVLYSTWNNLNHSQESQTNSQQCRFGSNWRSLWVSPQHAQCFTLVGNIAEKKGTQQVGCPTNLEMLWAFSGGSSLASEHSGRKISCTLPRLLCVCLPVIESVDGILAPLKCWTPKTKWESACLQWQQAFDCSGGCWKLFICYTISCSVVLHRNKQEVALVGDFNPSHVPQVKDIMNMFMNEKIGHQPITSASSHHGDPTAPAPARWSRKRLQHHSPSNGGRRKVPWPGTSWGPIDTRSH